MNNTPNERELLRSDAGEPRAPGSLFEAPFRTIDELMQELREQRVAQEKLTEQLHQSEAALGEWKKFIEHTATGVAFGMVEGHRISWTNAVYARMHGYTVEELRGIDAASLYAPESREYIPGEDSSSANNRHYSHECLRLRKDGSTFPARVEISIVVNPDRNLGFISCLYDLTAIKRTESQISASLSLLQTTLESANEAILVVDLAGTWVLHNQRFIDLWAIPNELIASKDARAALSFALNQLEDTAAFLNKIRELYASPEANSFDLLNFKNGSVVEIYSMPHFVENKVVGRIWSFRDVTERIRAEEGVRKSAETIADLYHNAPCGYHSLDHQGVFLIINDTELAWLGYTREELIGKMKWPDFLTPASFLVFQRSFPLMKERGFVNDLELEIIRKDGTTFIGLLNASAIYDVDGCFLMSRATIFDITARKSAELALAESEDRFRLIMETIDEVFWMADATLENMLYISPGYERVWGRTTQSLYQNPHSFIEAIHPEDMDRVIVDLGAQRNGLSFDHEYRVIRPDGSVRWVWDRGFPIRDRDGNLTRYAGIAQDITERKQNEQLLLNQKSFIRQIIDSDPNMISVKNAEGKFLAVNKAMAALHDKSPRELVGQYGAAPIRPDGSPDPIYLADREVIETLRPVELVTHEILNGQDRWFHITKVPMQQPDGKVYVLGIGVDITEKRLADQQLHDLTAHIQTVREEEKVSIAREIHDDLGGTLTALKIEIYWLTREVAEGVANKPALSRIESMSKLLDSAVYITRRVISDLHPTILDDLGLLAALEWQAGQFHKRTGIECIVNCTQDDDCSAEINQQQAINLFRIFQEALTNISRHSGATRVIVDFNNGHEVFLSIRDNGCGLPEGHTIAPTSFGMRGMTERVKQLGGMIKFDSPQKGGLEVNIALPGNQTGRAKK